jgi:hypothetical protein
VIQKVLNYCFGTSSNNFLLKSYRGLILLSILKQKIEIKDKNFIDEINFFIKNHQEYNDKKIFRIIWF